MDKPNADKGKAVIRGRLTAAGRAAATDALRQEAERGWAASDRKAAKGRQRAKGRTAPRAQKKRDAEIGGAKGKPQAGRKFKRQSDRR
jgi:hypothetical protein